MWLKFFKSLPNKVPSSVWCFISALPSQPLEPRWAWWTPCPVWGGRRRGRATPRPRPSWESPCRGLAGSSEKSPTLVSCSREDSSTLHKVAHLIPSRIPEHWNTVMKNAWAYYPRFLKFALVCGSIKEIYPPCKSAADPITPYIDFCLFAVSSFLQELLWLMLVKPCVSLQRLRMLWTWRWSRTSSIHCRTSMKRIWRRFRYKSRDLTCKSCD